MVLPQTMAKFCQETGWFGNVAVGGPNPAIGGRINTVRYVCYLEHWAQRQKAPHPQAANPLQ